VVTTVIISFQGVGKLGIDLLRIAEDDSHWQMYNAGKWYEGPPADVFDFLTAEREDIWDDDDDDEWESSIDSMLLSPGTMTVLHEADINTIDELQGMTDEQLLRIKGIGKARVAEIREALEYEE
jgi:DNA-directed RNA polymerase alpha subunit